MFLVVCFMSLCLFSLSDSNNANRGSKDFSDFFWLRNRKLLCLIDDDFRVFLLQNEGRQAGRCERTLTHHRCLCHTRGISNLGPTDNKELSQRLIALLWQPLGICDTYQQVVSGKTLPQPPPLLQTAFILVQQIQ